MDVFNIHIEFDSKVFRDIVEKHIIEKEKAYVCVVDANVITIAQKDPKYREIVKNATINTCEPPEPRGKAGNRKNDHRHHRQPHHQRGHKATTRYATEYCRDSLCTWF